MNARELEAALAAERNEDRGDEHLPHLSDVAYKCLRQVWHRRRGVRETFTPGTLRKFGLGFDVEHGVAKRLTDAGHKVREGVRVAIGVEDGRIVGRELMAGYSDDMLLLEGEVIGHLDPVIVNADGSRTVVEVKTNGKMKPEDDCSKHYEAQAALEALALGGNAIVYVQYPRLFEPEERAHDIDVASWEPWLVERVVAVLEQTHPEAPEPPAEPAATAPWACSFCAVASCHKNTNRNLPRDEYAGLPSA